MVLRRPVASQWSFGLIGATLLASFVAVSILVAPQLQRFEPPPAQGTSHTPPADEPGEPLTVAVEGSGSTEWSVKLSGPPGRQVLISIDGAVLEVVALSAAGWATIVVEGSQMAESGSISASLLGPSTEVPYQVASRSRRAPAAAGPTPRPTPKPAVAADTSPRKASTNPRRALHSRPAVSAPPNLLRVPDAGRKVAITFDGGAISRGANGLLHVLELRDVRATLFLTGDFIRRETALIRKAVRDGHEVGNHTLDHPRLTTYASNRRHQLRPEISKGGFQRQLTEAELLFRERVGTTMVPLWRAPYGEENAMLRDWAFELGYLHARWSTLEGHSLDAWDWVEDEHSSIYEEPESMVQRLLSFPDLDGGIVLMHLGSRREVPSWTALPKLLDELEVRGIEVVPLTELLLSSATWRDRLRAAAARHRATFSALEPDPGRAPLSASQDPQTFQTDPSLPTSPSAPRAE